MLSPQSFHISSTSGVPIFRQIIDQVHALMAAGTLKVGDMLPSVREMSKSLEVNMMTVSKAYSRMESHGILGRVRGRGMRIRASSSSASLAERKQEFSEQVEPAIYRARQLSLTDEQILSVIQRILQERKT